LRLDDVDDWPNTSFWRQCPQRSVNEEEKKQRTRKERKGKKVVAGMASQPNKTQTLPLLGQPFVPLNAGDTSIPGVVKGGAPLTQVAGAFGTICTAFASFLADEATAEGGQACPKASITSAIPARRRGLLVLHWLLGLIVSLLRRSSVCLEREDTLAK
jgi:hypothetical protein